MTTVMFACNVPLTYTFVVPLTKMTMLLFYTTGLIPSAVEARMNMNISIDRIQSFIDLDDVDDASKQADDSIAMHDCSFTWMRKHASSSPVELTDVKHHTLQLDNVTIDVQAGELAVVIGKVGAGKSSILLALFDEMKWTNKQASSKHVSVNSTYLG